MVQTGNQHSQSTHSHHKSCKQKDKEGGHLIIGLILQLLHIEATTVPQADVVLIKTVICNEVEISISFCDFFDRSLLKGEGLRNYLLGGFVKIEFKHLSA